MPNFVPKFGYGLPVESICFKFGVHMHLVVVMSERYPVTPLGSVVQN